MNPTEDAVIEPGSNTCGMMGDTFTEHSAFSQLVSWIAARDFPFFCETFRPSLLGPSLPSSLSASSHRVIGPWRRASGVLEREVLRRGSILSPAYVRYMAQRSFSSRRHKAAAPVCTLTIGEGGGCWCGGRQQGGRGRGRGTQSGRMPSEQEAHAQAHRQHLGIEEMEAMHK
eukprot:3326652-Rhodomonas_salina.1